ncbi:unnamed protein product [Calypogeia fissa]
MSGVERAYNFGDLLRAAGSLNRLAEIESSKGGVVFPRVHSKMKTVWEELHPVLVDANGYRTIPIPNLGDFSQIQTDACLIEALKEGFQEAQKLLRVLEMAPSIHCQPSKARWFHQPWQFEQVLQKNSTDLASSPAEIGDDGDMELQSTNENTSNIGDPHCREEATPVVDLEASESQILSVLEANAVVEERHSILGVQHVLHEMQDALVPPPIFSRLGARINPKVSLPGQPGEYIWKARLVSQLNDNAFLSKDRLQRVKALGSTYYSEEELARLRDDPHVKSLSKGHDIAVLFERSPGFGSNAVANSLRSRQTGTPSDVDKTSNGEAFFELGRVQLIKRKIGGTFKLVEEILDIDNPGSTEVQILCLWYTPLPSKKNSKWKYDCVDRCFVNLKTVIQTVSLDYRVERKEYILSPIDHSQLIEYVKQQNA